MGRVTEDPNELASSLRAAIDDETELLLVDGFAGVGKTTLSGELASALGLPLVHLDDSLAKEQGSFLRHLDTAKLSQDLAQKSAAKKPVVVDGICGLAALARVNKEPDLLVYVMRMQGNQWSDAVQIPTSLAKEELASCFGALLDYESLPVGPPRLFSVEVNVAVEVGIYHFDYTPHRKYDFGFCRKG